MAATFRPRLSRRCGPKKLGLNLVSEQTDKGRVYRIKDGNASPQHREFAMASGEMSPAEFTAFL